MQNINKFSLGKIIKIIIILTLMLITLLIPKSIYASTVDFDKTIKYDCDSTFVAYYDQLDSSTRFIDYSFGQSTVNFTFNKVNSSGVVTTTKLALKNGSDSIDSYTPKFTTLENGNMVIITSLTVGDTYLTQVDSNGSIVSTTKIDGFYGDDIATIQNNVVLFNRQSQTLKNVEVGTSKISTYKVSDILPADMTINNYYMINVDESTVGLIELNSIKNYTKAYILSSSFKVENEFVFVDDTRVESGVYYKGQYIFTTREEKNDYFTTSLTSSTVYLQSFLNGVKTTETKVHSGLIYPKNINIEAIGTVDNKLLCFNFVADSSINNKFTKNFYLLNNSFSAVKNTSGNYDDKLSCNKGIVYLLQKNKTSTTSLLNLNTNDTFPITSSNYLINHSTFEISKIAIKSTVSQFMQNVKITTGYTASFLNNDYSEYTGQVVNEKLILALSSSEKTYYYSLKDFSAPIIDSPVLLATSSKVGQINLSWNKVQDADGYMIFREIANAFQPIATIENVNQTSFIDYGTTAAGVINSATLYKYSIYSYVVYNSEIILSENVSIASVVSHFLPPSNITAKYKGNAIEVSFKASEGDITGYEIYRKSTGSFEKIATLKGKNTVSYLDTKIQGSTVYTYCIKAYKETASSKVLSVYSQTAKNDLVKKGDINGDSNISITDFIMLKSHLLGKGNLTGTSFSAGDINGDGNITITDFIQLKSHLLGKITITN